MHNYGIICHMSEAPEKKVNTETEAPEAQGLDQDKFADLFDSLDEETLMKMMESAGLFSEDADVSPEDVSDIVVPDTAPEVSPEAAAGAAADKEAMLSPEHIEHMLSVLGDDIIGDMLDSAGLTDEDVAAVLAEAKAEGEAAEAAADGTAPPAADKKGKPQGKRRKGRNVRRLLFVLIFIGILGLVAAVNKIYNSVTINSNDPIQYSEQTDEIYAEEGTLHVNNVSVTVPTNGTEEYSISYSWSEKDSKYPSVPHAITAIYPKQSEKDEETETVEKAGGDKAAGKEEGADALLKAHVGKNLHATSDVSVVKKQDVVVFVTGTPVDEHLNPKIHDVVKVLDAYLPLLNKRHRKRSVRRKSRECGF